MSRLESWIESALAAAAEEIAPADIPELRLPTPRERRARLLPPGEPLERRRWLAPLAAAVSVAVVLTSLVVLGHAPWGDRGGTWPESLAVSRAQRLLAKEALDSYFPATGAEYTAGLTFAWTRKKILAKDTAACMAGAGFPQPAFSLSKRNYVLHFTDRGRFPDLAQPLRFRGAAPGSGSIAGRQIGSLPRGDRPAYAAATRHCLTAHARTIARLDKLSAPLSASWMEEVARIQSSTIVRAKRAAFISCLELAGVPARYANLGGPDGNQLLAGYFAWMNELGGTNTGRMQLAGTQRSWAPVFVTCAKPAVGTMERLQIAAKDLFLLAHAGQIGAIRQIAIDLLPGRRT
jgi:hypothetical protein